MAQTPDPDTGTSLLAALLNLALVGLAVSVTRQLVFGLEAPMGMTHTPEVLLLDFVAAAVLVVSTIRLVSKTAWLREWLPTMRTHFARHRKMIAGYFALGAALAVAVQGLALLIVILVQKPATVFTGFNTWLAIPGALILASFTAIYEEAVYRGLALKLLLHRFSPLQSASIQAVAFAAFHIPGGKASAAAILTVAIVGFLFALIVLATASLWTAIAAHFAYNFVAALFFGGYVSVGWRDGLFARSQDATGVSANLGNDPMLYGPALFVGAVACAYFWRHREMLRRPFRPERRAPPPECGPSG